jgi:Na+/melibiose symporter-like transporter
MTRSIRLWFEVAAYTITITSFLAVAALAIRVEPRSAEALAIFLSLLSALFFVVAGMAVKRRRIHRRDPASLSIKEELELRKLRGQGVRVQFR